MLVRARYSNNRSFILINPNPSYKRIIKKEGFIYRDTSVNPFFSLPCCCCWMRLSTSICSVVFFLKASFSSKDAVLICTFLGTFCLNPHLRSIQGICGYNDILSRFSLLPSPQPVLWSSILDCCFLLTLFLCCKYLLLLTQMVFHFLVYSLTLLSLLPHIFLTKHRPMFYVYEDLWLHEQQIFCLDKLS
jgi:hypothetical protein